MSRMDGNACLASAPLSYMMVGGLWIKLHLLVFRSLLTGEHSNLTSIHRDCITSTFLREDILRISSR